MKLEVKKTVRQSRWLMIIRLINSKRPVPKQIANKRFRRSRNIAVDLKAARVSSTSDAVSVLDVNKVPMYSAWGVTAASFSTGMVFGLLVNQSNNMAEYVGGCGTTSKGILLCTSDSEGEAYYWEARRRAIVADVGYGLSAVSVATAVWLTYKVMNDSSKSVASSVWIAPDGLGLQGDFNVACILEFGMYQFDSYVWRV